MRRGGKRKRTCDRALETGESGLLHGCGSECGCDMRALGTLDRCPAFFLYSGNERWRRSCSDSPECGPVSVMRGAVEQAIRVRRCHFQLERSHVQKVKGYTQAEKREVTDSGGKKTHHCSQDSSPCGRLSLFLSHTLPAEEQVGNLLLLSPLRTQKSTEP